MGDKQTIAYKTWLESLNEPAPEGVWEAVADQLDIDQVWEDVLETLDLDDVWNQIEATLPETVPAAQPPALERLPRLFWIAAAVVLITLTTPVQDRPVQHKESVELSHAETKMTESLPSTVRKNSNLNSGREERTDKQNIEKTVKPMAEVNQQIPLMESTSITSVVADKLKEQNIQSLNGELHNKTFFIKRENPIVTEDILAADSILIPLESDSVQQIAQEDSVRKDEQTRSSQWQIGLIAGIKNTWLLNPETSNGLKRSSLSSTKVTWGKEFGVTVQRSVGHKSFVQAEYYFYSEIGQRYQEYIDVLYQTKNIRLNYQKIQFVYRIRVFEKRKLPPVYFAAGLHASKLTLASTSIGGEGQIVTEEYMPWDYGVLAGMETEFSVTDKLILVPGIRAAYGMRNIYGGNSQLPANLNKTNTATIGISLGIRYAVGKAKAGL